MENRINQVMVINENLKYFILRQGIYNGDNYFVCSKLSDDEQSLTEKFDLLHEVKKDGKSYVELVTDTKLSNLLLSKLGLID